MNATQPLRVLIAATMLLVGFPAVAVAQLPRYGLATRVELHMLPAVSTGPLDPVWSPDGQRIAFTMRGDIWTIPAGGGAATALTAGPGYYFEPAWSPRGDVIAASRDVGGNLDVVLVGVDDGAVRALTSTPGVDVQPTWSPDGRSVFFASSRSGDFDIFRVDIGGGEAVEVVSGRGHQFQPAVSPDGSRIAYVAPVPGRMGSGGLWVRALSPGEPLLVHYEETSYRPRPRWTPDGISLVYASDAAGTYDLAVVPAAGGNRVRLTDRDWDEFAPSVSPDGSAVAFVSNRRGPSALHVTPIGGAGGGLGTEVVMTRRIARVPTGSLRGTVRGPGGDAVPARVSILADDGRGYTPDGGFHRVSPANEIHYFHADGPFVVEVPAGRVHVEALRGFEYVPADASVDVPAGGTAEVELRLDRLFDGPAAGWYSGDTHVHDLHEGRYGLTQDEFFRQLVADDLHVANDLIHMDGTKLMGRWSDLTGRNHPRSDDRYILRYAQEFRGSYGHVGLLGIDRFVMPLIGGARGSVYAADVLKLDYLDNARTQGGIGGFLHPYNGDVGDPAVAAQADIPIHVALGRGDFFDVVSIASDEMASAAMYYRLLNTGARLPATGGTDNFSNVWRDPSGGTARTYVNVDGALTFASWIDGVRAGRTFATNGPLLMLEVDGRGPGAEIQLGPDDPATLPVKVTMRSIAPVARLEIIVNGEVAVTVRASGDATTFDVDTTVTIPGSGWVLARVIGGRHRYIGDNYGFAQTSPVYVVRDGQPFVSERDARFLTDVISTLWRRVDARDGFASPEGKAAYRAAVDEAIAVLRRRAQQAR